jgi:hypothetical protein
VGAAAEVGTVVAVAEVGIAVAAGAAGAAVAGAAGAGGADLAGAAHAVKSMVIKNRMLNTENNFLVIFLIHEPKFLFYKERMYIRSL